MFKNEDEDRRIVRNSAACVGCGDKIESTYRHDFKTCSCGNLSVDGGKSYTRRLWGDKVPWIETSLYEGDDVELENLLQEEELIQARNDLYDQRVAD